MTPLEVVRFTPVKVEGEPLGIDGLDIKCSLETSWCRTHSAGAGGFDEHHEWPKSLGGSDDNMVDGQHLLTLCPTHHRRQHALIHAMVEAGTTSVRTLRSYTVQERTIATYAVANWVRIGRPKIAGWPSPPAILRSSS